MHEVEDGKLTLSTGVVFKIMDIPLFAFDKIKENMERERPKVPVVYIEAKDREEANPNDPDYIAAIDAFERKQSEKLIDMIIVLGTELDQVPEGFPKDDDESWTSKLKLLGFDIPEDKDERYLTWIKLCAMRTREDYESLLIACSRSAGVTEEDVAEAAASFRDSKKRAADS